MNTYLRVRFENALTKYHENALTDAKEWLEERKLTLNLDKSKTNHKTE